MYTSRSIRDGAGRKIERHQLAPSGNTCFPCCFVQRHMLYPMKTASNNFCYTALVVGLHSCTQPRVIAERVIAYSYNFVAGK
jgi:hypothetical protein